MLKGVGEEVMIKGRGEEKEIFFIFEIFEIC